jgi:hypothetical protein
MNLYGYGTDRINVMSRNRVGCGIAFGKGLLIQDALFGLQRPSMVSV